MCEEGEKENNTHNLDTKDIELLKPFKTIFSPR